MLCFSVLQNTLDMHQSQEKFSARQYTRSPARATRSPKIFLAVDACQECFAILEELTAPPPSEGEETGLFHLTWRGSQESLYGQNCLAAIHMSLYGCPQAGM